MIIYLTNQLLFSLNLSPNFPFSCQKMSPWSHKHFCVDLHKYISRINLKQPHWTKLYILKFLINISKFTSIISPTEVWCWKFGFHEVCFSMSTDFIGLAFLKLGNNWRFLSLSWNFQIVFFDWFALPLPLFSFNWAINSFLALESSCHVTETNILHVK